MCLLGFSSQFVSYRFRFLLIVVEENIIHMCIYCHEADNDNDTLIKVYLYIENNWKELPKTALAPIGWTATRVITVADPVVFIPQPQTRTIQTL